MVKWTQRELKILKRYFPNTKTSIVAEKLNSSTIRVSHKAQKLGIKKAPGFWFWTEAEKELLRKIYPNLRYSRTDIAGRIGRNITSVRAMAQVMGLRRRKKNSNDTKDNINNL